MNRQIQTSTDMVAVVVGNIDSRQCSLMMMTSAAVTMILIADYLISNNDCEIGVNDEFFLI
jgi:hypothetical protein